MGEAELFFKNKRKFDELSEENESKEIELSLGLSLNGRFGIDPNRPNNAALVRSSSVSNFIFSGGEAETLRINIETAGLGRAVSLPAATEEDWRKRKETQSIRRMEARRKRVEKMKLIGEVRMARDRGRPMGERHVAIRSNSSGSAPGASECELEVTPNQGSNIPVEARSINQNEEKQTFPIGTNTDQQSTKPSNNKTKETMKNMIENMPCVSTRGVGPSGKRIEGLLYQYSKGEEVRIVCVCHGSFLSPAEFVKHAGGGDVSHPLKHIVVNPSPLM